MEYVVYPPSRNPANMGFRKYPFETYPDIPIIPSLPKQSDYAAQCGECGILIPNGAWGYVCPNNNCPVQMKATC